MRFCGSALIILWLSISFSLCLGVHDQKNVDHVMVSIRGSTSIARTDDNFICATLDWWPPNKCDHGQCPWGRAGILNLDLKNEILYKAIKAFNPLRIRVGGSLQDKLFYNVGKLEGRCMVFHAQEKATFGFSTGCLHMKRWDELANFFNETGAAITFGLNALIGKMKIKNDTLYIGDWNSQNARDFMEYNLLKGHIIDSYELGNELCGGGVSGRVEAKQYAKDIIVLKQVVKELYPDPETRPKVLGPGGFYDEKWFNTFLQESGPFVVDGLTHHIYNLGEGIENEVINRVQDPYYLTQIAQTFKDISKTVNQFGPWSGAWVGESGGAYNSGSKDVSHTFANGFWYLDQMGMTSTFNHKVFCRQSLIGGNYGLLNTTSFIPNPDYYGALLWHRLMGSNVLVTTHNGSPHLRAYSHCSKTKPGVTVLLINMSNSTKFNVLFVNDNNLFTEPRMTTNKETLMVEDREEYHLTPKDGKIQSDVVLLNGKALRLNQSFDIPEIKPKLVNSTSPIQVAPHSFVFVTVTNFQAPACA